MKNKIFSTNEWLEFSEQNLIFSKTKIQLSIESIDFILRGWAVFDDNTHVSIQHSSFHHCYEHSVELGFPTFKVPDYLLEYAEILDEPNETVYSYVPFNIVNKLITDKNGINIKKSLELFKSMQKEVKTKNKIPE